MGNVERFYDKKAALAFTLAELLIALAILGVIATFTIPKILESSNNNKFNAVAKEAISMVTGAYQNYKLQNGVNATDNVLTALTPYMNYVREQTTGVVDNLTGATSLDCSLAAQTCLVLHNGGVLLTSANGVFGPSANTSTIHFSIDPDGVYSGSTTGPGKILAVFLYLNGRVRTYGTIEPNTYYNIGSPQLRNPTPAWDPVWFSWGS